jgi:hypothetical protein
MRETGEPTFVVSDCCWRARLRTRGSARSRGSRAVSTHGLNTQRMSAVQKVWSSHVCATMSLQHGPAAGAANFVVLEENFSGLERMVSDNSSGVGDVSWVTLVGTMNRGRNGKLWIQVINR